MLKISKLADYATQIIGYLVKHNDDKFSAAALAEALHIGAPTVTKVLKLLHEAKLVVSERGVHGGYRLARNAEQISLVDVVAAVDGKTAITQCCADADPCTRDDCCTMRSNWQAINRRVLHQLEKISMADMIKPLPHDLPSHAIRERV